MMRGRLSWQTEPGTRSGCGAFTSPMAAACSAPTPLLCFVCVCDAGGGGVTHHPYVAGGRRQDTRGNDLGTRSRLSLSISILALTLSLGMGVDATKLQIIYIKKSFAGFKVPCRAVFFLRPVLKSGLGFLSLRIEAARRSNEVLPVFQHARTVLVVTHDTHIQQQHQLADMQHRLVH
jgi:hypothetical protein